MLYSVEPPRSDAFMWKIVDDRGQLVFSGLRQQCEEWLDLTEMRNATSESSAARAQEAVTNRLPFVNRAAALLRRFWDDCAGEIRVLGESSAVFLMLIAMVCLSTLFVWPGLVQQASLVKAAPTANCGIQQCGNCARIDTETSSCANTQTLDIVCDAEDESF